MAKQVKCSVESVFINENKQMCLLLTNVSKPDQTFTFSINKYASQANTVFENYSDHTLEIIKVAFDKPLYVKKKKESFSNTVNYKLTDESKKDIIYSLKAAHAAQNASQAYL